MGSIRRFSTHITTQNQSVFRTLSYRHRPDSELVILKCLVKQTFAVATLWETVSTVKVKDAQATTTASKSVTNLASGKSRQTKTPQTPYDLSESGDFRAVYTETYLDKLQSLHSGLSKAPRVEPAHEGQSSSNLPTLIDRLGSVHIYARLIRPGQDSEVGTILGLAFPPATAEVNGRSCQYATGCVRNIASNQALSWPN
jgi:hypothetical protein